MCVCAWAAKKILNKANCKNCVTPIMCLHSKLYSLSGIVVMFLLLVVASVIICVVPICLLETDF